MAVKMRRNFSGTFGARSGADGTWRITRSAPRDVQIIVMGADLRSVPAVGAALRDPRIEWQEQRALLAATSAAGSVAVEARRAIVHEFVPELYAVLPLATFDARARRFWRRVFLLVRIPGGRRLLGMLAHASRNKS